MKRLIFEILQEHNVGTEENPVIKTEFRKAVAFANDTNYDEVHAFVMKQAYNGEVTVEEVPDPEPTEPTADELMDILLGVSE